MKMVWRGMAFGKTAEAGLNLDGLGEQGASSYLEVKLAPGQKFDPGLCYAKRRACCYELG